MITTNFATCANPLLYDSQIAFRIGLARERTSRYPLDSMNFIMMDLERPDKCSRHAHWCTGDLTGRLLEFLSCAEGIDGKYDSHLQELFERILKEKHNSGVYGRLSCRSHDTKHEDDITSGASRLFNGFIKYFECTKDMRALDAAVDMAERLISVKDDFIKCILDCHGNIIEQWITEPMARLYGIIKDKRYLKFCGDIASVISDIGGSHSHGLMSTLRGLQLATVYSGDLAYNEIPEKYLKKILDRGFERVDGCVCEIFPESFRNEGCSIADWLMMNLNAAFISNRDEDYDRAENILYNALFFNQFVTGGFGHRDLIPDGYSGMGINEAWWCCLHHCGMAMTEYVRHAVVLRENDICINFLVPGKYTFSLPEGGNLIVEIISNYPDGVFTLINIWNMNINRKVKVRIPGCIKNASLHEEKNGMNTAIYLNGELGHTIERYKQKSFLKYGPLILAPMVYYWDKGVDIMKSTVPSGYIPPSLPKGEPLIDKIPRDENGLLCLKSMPQPDWSYFDEGPNSRMSIQNAAVNVPIVFGNDKRLELRFWPLCYATSCMSYYDVPILFSTAE